MTDEAALADNYWNARPNTTDNEFAPYFFRHGHRMHRFLRVISRVDFPDNVDLPTDRPILFAANHRSFLDILVAGALFSHLGITCRFQVQARMFDRPIIGKWLTKLGCIPTNRAVREQAENTTVATLVAGHTVAVMPEGRLVPAEDRPGGVGAGRPGLSRIAQRSGAVVIPVACHGTDNVWPRGRPFPKLGLFRRRTVAVDFGEPMAFTSDDHQENVDALMANVAHMLKLRDDA